jgi:hypothetical protein
MATTVGTATAATAAAGEAALAEDLAGLAAARTDGARIVKLSSTVVKLADCLSKSEERAAAAEARLVEMATGLASCRTDFEGMEAELSQQPSPWGARTSELYQLARALG